MNCFQCCKGIYEFRNNQNEVYDINCSKSCGSLISVVYDTIVYVRIDFKDHNMIIRRDFNVGGDLSSTLYCNKTGLPTFEMKKWFMPKDPCAKEYKKLYQKLLNLGNFK